MDSLKPTVAVATALCRIAEIAFPAAAAKQPTTVALNVLNEKLEDELELLTHAVRSFELAITAAAESKDPAKIQLVQRRLSFLRRAARRVRYGEKEQRRRGNVPRGLPAVYCSVAEARVCRIAGPIDDPEAEAAEEAEAAAAEAEAEAAAAAEAEASVGPALADMASMKEAIGEIEQEEEEYMEILRMMKGLMLSERRRGRAVVSSRARAKSMRH